MNLKRCTFEDWLYQWLNHTAISNEWVYYNNNGMAINTFIELFENCPILPCPHNPHWFCRGTYNRVGGFDDTIEDYLVINEATLEPITAIREEWEMVEDNYGNNYPTIVHAETNPEWLGILEEFLGTSVQLEINLDVLAND